MMNKIKLLICIGISCFILYGIGCSESGDSVGNPSVPESTSNQYENFVETVTPVPKGPSDDHNPENGDLLPIQNIPTLVPEIVSNDDILPLGSMVADIVPCVVTILTEWVDYSYFVQPTPYKGAGSGIIFKDDGYIVTNGHVVDDAENITVILSDGQSLKAERIGIDPFTDLAVIKVDAKGLPVSKFGDSQTLSIGQPVIAIGNAFDLPGGYTVTQGIISCLGRSIETTDGIVLHGLIQTDAAINPGNSGGPLLTMEGAVIGINTAKIGGGADNIGFAVSSSTIEPVVAQLVKHGRLIWPWLGLKTMTLTPALIMELNLPDKQGVLIDEVYNGGPAEKAGLEKGDVILNVNDTRVTTAIELQNAVRQYGIGKEIEITYIRNYKTEKATATLQQIPSHF